MQHPARRGDERDLGRLPGLDIDGNEQLPDQYAEQRAVQHMDDKIGSLERPGIGRPVLAVDEECEQRNRPPRRAGRIAEDKILERLPVAYATKVSEPPDAPVIVE